MASQQSTKQSNVILIVDDDDNIRQVLEGRFSAAGYDVRLASSGEQALEVMSSARIDLVVSDVKMPGMSGDGLLGEVQQRWPGLPVIILTAYGSIDHAVQAVHSGAVDYVTKPFDGKELLNKVQEAFQPGRSRRSTLSDLSLEDRIWGGKSPRTQRLYELIERVAPADVDVLLTGESGTGKELVARVIHENSPLSEGPFAIVDCGATTTSLLESELFGHKKGAFTGAVQDKEGLLSQAHQGTLFLDEVGNIPLEMQAKLLRFLQERTLRPVGDTREASVNCRVIAATNAELSNMVKEGGFREDLYFRLKGFTINLPPLRERPEDIPLLAERFLALSAPAKSGQIRISHQAMESLVHYHWPGNVRELQQTMRSGALLARNGELQAEELQLEDVKEKSGEDVISPGSLEESERQTIVRALEQSGWVQKRAAELLGISRRAMHYKVKKFRIAIPR
jgi:DNA-binding NtrC family response regulator